MTCFIYAIATLLKERSWNLHDKKIVTYLQHIFFLVLNVLILFFFSTEKFVSGNYPYLNSLCLQSEQGMVEGITTKGLLGTTLTVLRVSLYVYVCVCVVRAIEWTL